jgi:hypothetical protein
VLVVPKLFCLIPSFVLLINLPNRQYKLRGLKLLLYCSSIWLGDSGCEAELSAVFLPLFTSVDERVGSTTTAVKYEEFEGELTRLGSSGPARDDDEEE